MKAGFGFDGPGTAVIGTMVIVAVGWGVLVAVVSWVGDGVSVGSCPRATLHTSSTCHISTIRLSTILNMSMAWKVTRWPVVWSRKNRPRRLPWAVTRLTTIDSFTIRLSIAR